MNPWNWTEDPTGASDLGCWVTDDQGLPAYRFTAAVPLVTRTPAGRPYPLDPDPFFLLGNDRLTVFPRVSGLYRLVTGERGWTRLNEALGDHPANRAHLTTRGPDGRTDDELVGPGGAAADPRRTRRHFGCGYAAFETQVGQTTVRRTLAVAPNADGDRGVPVLRITVTIVNPTAEARDYSYSEAVLSHPVLGIELGRPEADRTVRFTNEATVDSDAAAVWVRPTAVSDDPGILRPATEPNKYSLYPPNLVLWAPRSGLPPQSTVELHAVEVAPGATEIEATVHLRLAPKTQAEVTFLVGLTFREPLEELAGWAELSSPDPDRLPFADRWTSALSAFLGVPDPLFRRELTWNAHALSAMATYSEFYGEVFIPQGMTYDYQMDLTAAPRDHLQHAMAAAYFRPALAKSTIRFVLSKMTDQGEIKYTDFGYGKTSNSAWNTSDQQLYLFQGLGEYLRITGDVGFWDEETTYLPRRAHRTGTVLEKVDRALTYLRDEVGFGPHGLIRLMNSDWSDMVFADRSVLKSWHTAESHMNTAMAVAVLPNLIRQLEVYRSGTKPAQAALAETLSASLRHYLDRIRRAWDQDLGDRPFSTRLHFDRDESFGAEDLHIEPQSHLLQIEDFPAERKRRLWTEVQARLDAGEVLGPRQRELPVEGGLIEPFVSENGGFWYSLAGQMIIGVASFDMPEAERLLRRMTFENFSRAYPGYWTGLWSGADTVNSAASGDLAGLPRPDNNGLWTTFASYCAHAHAWPIYCWARLQEERARTNRR